MSSCLDDEIPGPSEKTLRDFPGLLGITCPEGFGELLAKGVYVFWSGNSLWMSASQMIPILRRTFDASPLSMTPLRPS